MENKKFFLAFFSLIGVLFILIMIKSSKKKDKIYQAQLKKEILNNSLNSSILNQSFINNDTMNVQKENSTLINSSQTLETVNNSLQVSTLDSSKVFPNNNSINTANNDSELTKNIIKENITTIDVLLSNTSMNEYYEKNKDYNQRITRKRNYENDYPSDKRTNKQTNEEIKKDNLTDPLTKKLEKIIDLENQSSQIKEIKNQAKHVMENKLSSVSSELDNLKTNLKNEEEKEKLEKHIKIEMDKLNNSLKQAEKNINKATIESYYNSAEKNGLINTEESKIEALNKSKDEEFFNNIMNKLKVLNLTEEEENKLNNLFHNKQDQQPKQLNNNNLTFMQNVNEIINETINFFNEVVTNTSIKINKLNNNIITYSETKNIDEKITFSNETYSDLLNSTNTSIANTTEQTDTLLKKDITNILPETNQTEKLNSNTSEITNITGYNVNNISLTGEIKPNIGFIGVLGKFLQLLIIVGFLAALIFITLSYLNIKQKKIHRRKKFDDVNEESLNTEITYNLLI